MAGEPTVELIDLPGVYSLSLDGPEASVCRRVIDGELMPAGERIGVPDAACIVVDATNLPRNLPLVVEVLGHGRPTVVAINMVDVARRRGIHADEDILSARLGCPVVVCSARTGEGVERLHAVLRSVETPPSTEQLPGEIEEIESFVKTLCAEIGSRQDNPDARHIADWIDGVLTHSVWGLAVFAGVMAGLFWVIFALAAYPMAWIELIFSRRRAARSKA